jgi:hypothetical protein
VFVPDHGDLFDKLLLDVYFAEVSLFVDLEDSDAVFDRVHIVLGLDQVLDCSEAGVLGGF